MSIHTYIIMNNKKNPAWDCRALSWLDFLARTDDTIFVKLVRPATARQYSGAAQGDAATTIC